ncbi:hypothetical protein AAMO2058_001717900 [Amorphochlora amoebiformis]
MSQYPCYNLVWADGHRTLALTTEQERLNAYTGAYHLTRMQWRDEDIDEDDFKDYFKVWIANQNDLKGVDLKANNFGDFFRENSSKFLHPSELRDMEMFEKSAYVCVMKGNVPFKRYEMQSAGMFGNSSNREEKVHFRNESKTHKVKIVLFPDIGRPRYSKEILNAAIEGGYKGLSLAFTGDNKRPTERDLKPEENEEQTCPSGKGNYIAFVLDTDSNEWVYFQNCQIKSSAATEETPEILNEITMTTFLENYKARKEEGDGMYSALTKH